MTGRKRGSVKREKRAAVVVTLDGGELSTGGEFYRDGEGAWLYCGCGAVTEMCSWALVSLEGVCECGLRYREPASSSSEMSASPSSEMSASPSSEMSASPSSERVGELRELTDEWLDLSVRLEILEDEKSAWRAKFDTETKAIKKRIGEIRNELNALKTGETVPVQVEAGNRQIELFEEGAK